MINRNRHLSGYSIVKVTTTLSEPDSSAKACPPGPGSVTKSINLRPCAPESRVIQLPISITKSCATVCEMIGTPAEVPQTLPLNSGNILKYVPEGVARSN